MNDNTLEIVQNELFKILKEIKKVCEKNNITYFLDSGTLLGAIRHNGFIPWDDDIDIVMLRDDYNKFQQNSKELLSKYDVYINDIKKDYYKSWTKVGSRSVKIKEKNGNVRGVYVDIFPYDYYSPNRLKRLLVDRFFKFKRKKNVFFENCIINIQRLVSSSILKYDTKIYVNMKNRFCNLTNKKSSLIGYGKEMEKFEYYIEYDEVFPLTKVVFEGEHFYAPNNYDKFLKLHYGNSYMELPPENERYSHNQGFICE